MKFKNTFTVRAPIFSNLIWSQNNSGNNVRFVEVTGYAEQEVIPDKFTYP